MEEGSWKIADEASKIDGESALKLNEKATCQFSKAGISEQYDCDAIPS